MENAIFVLFFIIIVVSIIGTIIGCIHDCNIYCPKCHKRGEMRLVLDKDGKFKYVCDHCGYNKED